MATSVSRGPGCLDDDTVLGFLEGALSAEERAAVDAHVDGCPACLALVAAVGRGGDREDTQGGESFAPGAMLGPGARVGRYEIVRWLGRGGMGSVYAARDPELDRNVALKLLRGSLADEQSRLHREAQAMAQLAHPNVAAVHDVGWVDERVFIALELIDGPTLGAWLAEGHHGLAETVEVLVQAGRGLVAAHQAGIVHRDFKPDNVMIGADGRVRVLDFGLARGRSSQGAPMPDDRSAWMTTLTVDGAFVGTPSYMSPEQYRGEPADDRSDQFSFCVVLHEALYGERPFVGGSFEELSAAVTSGRVHEPASGARYRGIRRVILRGLSVDPAERWPSMDTLLRALERAVGRRRWGWAAGGLVVAGLGVGGWVWFGREARLAACEREGAAIVDHWTLQRPAMATALGQHGRTPSATVDTVLVRLDAYAEHWGEVRSEQCEAARVHETLSPQMWTRMSECLDDRRRSFDAVTNVLSDAYAETVPRALAVVEGLDAIDACLDESGLLRRLDLPEDPQVRAAVNELRAELAEANPLAETARFERGAELSASVLERAKALGYVPLEIEALFWTGSFAARGDDTDVDLGLLEEAAERAGEIGHDEIAAQAAMELLVAYTERANFDVAEVWGRFARMALGRLGDSGAPELSVFVQTRLGSLARARGDFDAAERELAIAHERAKALDSPRPLGVVLSAQGEVALERSENAKGKALLQQSLEILREELGLDHPEVAVVGETLALAHMRSGEPEEAEALLQEGIRIHRITSGEEHPVYARALNNLGALRLQQRRWADARDLLQQAVAIRERAGGVDSPDTADFRESLALALTNLGEYEEALKIDREVLRVLEKNRGPEHPSVAEAETSIGLVLRRLGRNAEARQHYQRALAILEVAFPEGERRTANVLNNLGVVAMLEDDVAAAERFHRRALAIRERIYPEDHEMVVVSRLRLGEALCALDRCAEGRPLLEQGVAAEVETLPAKIRAAGLLALARAVELETPQRARALREEAAGLGEG